MMRTLFPELRKQLERTVGQARDVAEEGARAALEALAVQHHEPYGHMTSEQRTLRRRLRAHARQLGDRLDARSGSQGTDHLVHECAYEHWHGMLFARFLAENHLLIEPEMGVAISLEECEELAKEEGSDKWALAARFAHRMLPQVFRPDHPVFEVRFAREYRLKLESLVEDLAADVFTATDSLGWVYQFWQSKKKDEVNRSEVKIGADELPAVTQLFTEPYMVQFLLHNSLGAWWVGRYPDRPCPVDLTYLRLAIVEAASSRLNDNATPNRSKEIGYFHKDNDIANLSGNLPHWRQDGVTYFVTFRTADSLPQEKLKQWLDEKKAWLKQHPEPHDEQMRKEFYEKFPERIQQWLDRGYGECLLKQAKLRSVVENALEYFDGERYDLDEFVVMPNHVHALVTPKDGWQLSDILHSWKSFTANAINKETENKIPFWQKESFDHIVRSPAHLEKIRQYIREHSAYGNKRQDAASTLWQPAAGIFDGWPDDLSQFRLLDPCCGSGHFLVVAFLMLVPMRMALEGLNPAEAVDAVLRDNLHGLELDQRCVAIAAFALALEAWRYPNAGGYRPLPRLNLAWSGQPVFGKREQWLALADGDERLEAGMTALYDTFREAPVLGSLIDPTRSVTEDLLTAGFVELRPLLERALREHAGDEEWEETAIAARGLAEAARLLGAQYHLVVTNVPYLARGKQSQALRKFAEGRYAKAKNDLANVFLERCLELSLPEGAGVTQIVMPQNWLFLTSYKGQREHLLREARWDLLARLGPGAFDTISGEVVNVILLTLTHTRPTADACLHGLDASAPRTAREKAEVLREGEMASASQEALLSNPDCAIAFADLSAGSYLGDYAKSIQGLATSDDPSFVRVFWELESLTSAWRYLQSAVKELKLFGGLETVLFWENGNGRYFKHTRSLKEEGRLGGWKSGQEAWGRQEVSVAEIRSLPSCIYSGEFFDHTAHAIVPDSVELLPAVYLFVSSTEFVESVRRINQKLNVTNSTLVKIPFDRERWESEAHKSFPGGLPKSYSDDPTQWIFHGHPRPADSPLQVAVARLLGYHWPAERESRSGFQPLEEEREDGTPTNFRVEAASRRLETRRDGASTMELSDEARAWIDKTKALNAFEDEDGIVCLPSIRGEPVAHERLLHLLKAAWGEEWSNSVPSKLVWDAGAGSLDDWLRNHFFEQHCKLFHHCPFIWHIWDGRKRDGFHVLVNYHKLAEADGKGRRLLETLTYSYLGDWIARQQDGVKRGEGGAEGRLAAALELQKRLVAIIEGEPSFDIFVRWKPIEEQPIGWEPDINDGVRLNIRPFVAQDIPGGKTGAGILRAKPNVDWNKDRGKEPMRPRKQFPWFWNADKFTGERVNDVHLTAAEKRAARERAEAKR